MSTLRQALLGLALIAALGLLIWGQQQRIKQADTQASASAQLASQWQQEVARVTGHANQLSELLKVERNAQTSLRKTQDLLRQGLTEREQRIEVLKRENQAFKNWAAQPLPEPVSRLRQRPAITGADAYRQWLSGSGALHPLTEQPQP
ncbi:MULTISPECIES: Rz-like lysis system protein LysB [Pseudomonas]|uniref:Rz-like lysis system protein LysB n=1 Tax=Pseudomonas TaxID=286 RepID=UPI0008E0DE4C|nr:MULTISPECIES: Rz-like lysis system protein LysB [Pseudomonas]SFT48931.1 phage lysis regulatory protein, LysB family [Pseudomonas marincola]